MRSLWPNMRNFWGWKDKKVGAQLKLCPHLGVDKVNTLRKNELFIFSSCIIFLSPSVTAGRGSGHLGRSDGAASKSSILPSAVAFGDLEAQRASNLAAYMPPLRIKYEGAAAPSCIPKVINRAC